MKKLLIIIYIFPLTLFSQNTDLKKTKFFPHISGKISQDTNSVYCAGFQIAWNNLKDSIIGEKIKVNNQPDYLTSLNSYETDNIIDDNHILKRKSNFNFD